MCDSYIGLDHYHQIDLSDVNDYLQGGATTSRAKGLEQFSAYSQLRKEVVQDSEDLPTSARGDNLQ